MLQEWVLSKLESVQDTPRVLLRDPLHLLPPDGGMIHQFGIHHQFTVVIAATNLRRLDMLRAK